MIDIYPGPWFTRSDNHGKYYSLSVQLVIYQPADMPDETVVAIGTILALIVVGGTGIYKDSDQTGTVGIDCQSIMPSMGRSGLSNTNGTRSVAHYAQAQSQLRHADKYSGIGNRQLYFCCASKGQGDRNCRGLAGTNVHSCR